MSAPRQHLPEGIVLAYAAGALPEALNLLVATHLALCPDCYRSNQLLDMVGGALMLGESSPVADDLLAATLRRLDEAPPAVSAATPPRADLPDLPNPLRAVIGDRPWVTVTSGIRVIELPVRFGPEPVRLTQLVGPLTVPRHGHRGVEAQLVLGGGFSDGEQSFRRGDVQWAGVDLEHAIDIHPGEPCVTLLVKDAPLIQRTLRGKLFSWMTGV